MDGRIGNKWEHRGEDDGDDLSHEANGRESPAADTWRRHTMVAPPFLVSPLVDLTSSILSATDPLVPVSPPAGGCDFVSNLRRPIAEYCGPYRKQGARDMHHPLCTCPCLRPTPEV